MRDRQKNLLCVACHLRRESDRLPEILASDATKDTTVIPTKESHDCETTLQAKLEWAVSELRVTTDVKQCIELTVLVKGLVECMKLLRDVK